MSVEPIYKIRRREYPITEDVAKQMVEAKIKDWQDTIEDLYNQITDAEQCILDLQHDPLPTHAARFERVYPDDPEFSSLDGIAVFSVDENPRRYKFAEFAESLPPIPIHHLTGEPEK